MAIMLMVVLVQVTHAQTFTPVTVTGYNEDVVADGTGNSSLATTTREMDAFTPSNFVICTQQFATANAITGGYGIPDNGTITSGTRQYQLAPLGNGTAPVNSVLYLMKNETGTLTLTTPAAFSQLSFLGLATEGAASVSAIVTYTDGTIQSFPGLNIQDWVGGANPILQGFGRIKRQNGPFAAGSYEQAPTNPRMYATDIAVQCNKMVASISFTNMSTGTNTQSNRAFIFAVSGVQVIVAQQPAIAPATICPGTSASLSVQSPVAGLNYTWYATPSGGAAVGTGTTFNSPNLSATTAYYVQSSNNAGCNSPRTTVVVTVLAPVAAPAATAPAICSGSTATISVTNPDAGSTYDWFTAATGGTAIHTGTSFTTPALMANTTYYVQATGANGCTSTRQAVTVTVNPAPAAPQVTAATICNNATATLTISNAVTGTTYNWYSAATGGTALATGTSFTTPALTASTTYYVAATNNSSCTSSRTDVTVTVLPTVAAPTVAAAQVCSGSTATLTVSGAQAGTTYSWFTTATGGTAIASGTSFTTPALSSNTTYYVQATTIAGCTSDRTFVAVTILAPLAVPAADAVTICSGATATLAVANPQAGTTYSWFAAATGGTALHTGNSYTTPALTAATTYYIQAQNTGGCVSASRGAVMVSMATVLATPTVTASDISASSVTFTWAPVTGATGYEVAVNGGSYGAPSSGPTGTQHQVSGLAPGTVVTIAVRALGAQACQASSAGTANPTTLSNNIFIPNVFTPNGDGRNDIFRVYGNDLAAVDLRIFNQWGEMIYETRDMQRGWDGSYKGRQQPVGVYVYAASITLRDGSNIVKKGSFSLVR
ncbi:gliding motility-associated C-terminal domain-containing protein [Aridibaculum aurantiacum]|uniref:Ig-like domain-containing protein n=1 Tax=Aridibaculum aurantiacum TaxID=2810307 RepID=UPI001A973F14|nr:gliding motility-associated C-terminal domain-containing protein [Aridibaculum aurantiacum]